MNEKRTFHIGLKNLKAVRDLLNELPVLIDGIDEDFEIKFWNKACERSTGYSFEKIKRLDDPFRVLYPNPGYLQKMVKDNGKKGNDNSLKNGEWELVAKNGEKRTIVWSNFNLDPPILGAQTWGIGIDITEFKRTKEQLREDLRESEQKYRSMAEQTLFGIFIVQGEEIVYMNPGFAKILGFEMDEIIHWDLKRANKQIHPEDLEHIFKEKDQFPKKTFRIITKSGKIKWVSQTSKTIDYKGKKSNFIIFVDVTEQKEAEKELFEVKLREQKIESLAILAGGIAHDFNNLLVGILGNVNLLQLSKNLSNEDKDYLSEIEKASIRAKDLTHQLLTFSKGGTPIKKPSNIINLVQESISLVKPGQNCEFNLEISTDETFAEVDSGQIIQVFNNILINAVQAMPNGGTVNISIQDVHPKDLKYTSLSKKDYMVISIEDTGKGIPKNDREKVFTPYYTTKEGGSGLGLAVAYSIVKKHKGLLSFQSEVDKGTTFNIILPKIHPKKIKRNCADSRQQKNTHFSGNILIMDDEQSVRMTLGRMLEKLGFKVDKTENGEQAVKYYKTNLQEGNPYHLIILDITVPNGLGGKETLQILRNIDPEVKAIVSSGYSNNPVMSHASDYGFQEVLLKPYTMSKLKGCIENVFDCNQIDH